jgi:hypothetical protein
MTMLDILSELGIQGLRKVSDSTTVVELKNGYCYPATQMEERMWNLLRRISHA